MECPLCSKGTLSLVRGNTMGLTVLLFFLFRPGRLIYFIYGCFVKKYKCNVCGKLFDPDSFDLSDKK